MKLIYVFIILLIITLSSCSSKIEKKEVSEKDLISKTEDSVINANNLFVDVIMKNDTLNTREQNGVINFFFKLEDTIKLSLKDKRRIFTIIALVSKSDNKKNVKSVEIEKELNFSPINSKDTIKIPFKITSPFSGKARIITVISDIYTLHSYSKASDKVRMIMYEYSFEKEVYIK